MTVLAEDVLSPVTVLAEDALSPEELRGGWFHCESALFCDIACVKCYLKEGTNSPEK